MTTPHDDTQNLRPGPASDPAFEPARSTGSPDAATHPTVEEDRSAAASGDRTADELRASDPPGVSFDSAVPPVVTTPPPGKRGRVRAVVRHRATQLIAVGVLGLVIGGGTVALVESGDGGGGHGRNAQVVSGDRNAGSGNGSGTGGRRNGGERNNGDQNSGTDDSDQTG